MLIKRPVPQSPLKGEELSRAMHVQASTYGVGSFRYCEMVGQVIIRDHRM